MRSLLGLLAAVSLALLALAGTAAFTERTLARWIGTTAVVDPAPALFQEPFHGRPSEPIHPLDPARWELLAAPGVTARPTVEGLLLDVPRATPGWLRPRLPLEPQAAGGSGVSETLQWETRVDAVGRFFVVAELRFAPAQGAILLQATPVDLQITTVTGEEERSDSVPYPTTNDGRFHLWRITLANGELALALDGSRRWDRPLVGRLASVRFGEVRTDDLHGGQMWLRDVVYVGRGGRV